MKSSYIIRNFVKKNELEKAAEELLNTVLDDVGIALKRRITDLNEQLIKHTLTPQEENIQKNKIADALIEASQLLEDPNIENLLGGVRDLKNLESEPARIDFENAVKRIANVNNTARELRRWRIFTIISLVIGLLGLLYGNGITHINKLPDWATGYSVKGDQIDIWKKFNSSMHYFNAPFTKIDPPHTDFKREFLLSNANNSFELLFFRGQDTSLYKAKLMGFLKTLDIILKELSQEEQDLVKRKIKVRLSCNSDPPRFSFFKSYDKKGKDIVLEYFNTGSDSITENNRGPDREIFYPDMSKIDGEIDGKKYTEIWNSEWDMATDLKIFELLKRYREDRGSFLIGDCSGL